MDDLSINPREAIGGNNPPEPTPFDLSREEIEGLYMEAKNWCDGEPVETQDQADAIGKLMNALRAAAKTADARRVVEKKPFDDAAAEVQARYNPLIQAKKGKVDTALDACKSALAPFLKRLDDLKQEEIRIARQQAEEARKAAEEAFRKTNVADLAAREEAERLANDAKEAQRIANQAEKINVGASTGGRSVSLRTVYRTEMTDAREAARHYWVARKSDLEAIMLEWAKSDVGRGIRSIPGFTITEEKVPV